MNNLTIVDSAIYQHKQNTATSYLYVSGTTILPKTLSIMEFPAEMQSFGRRNRVRQLKGTFTNGEQSPYKQSKPYKVNTSIWKVEGFSDMYYGTLGVSGAKGRIEGNNGDLIILYTEDWELVRVFIFFGIARASGVMPDVLKRASNYVSSLVLR